MKVKRAGLRRRVDVGDGGEVEVETLTNELRWMHPEWAKETC